MQYGCSRVYSLKRSQFETKYKYPTNNSAHLFQTSLNQCFIYWYARKVIKCNKDTVQMACSLLQHDSMFGRWYQTLWTKYPQQKKWSKRLPVQVPLHLTTYSSNIVKCTFSILLWGIPDSKNDSGIHFCIIYK